MKRLLFVAAAALTACAAFAEFAGRDPRYPGFAEQNFKLPMRVMIIGAHPDDADFYCGATAIKLAKAGAKVRFVSLCNGNKGHQTMTSPALAARRYGETQRAAKAYGIESYTVGEAPDCEIEPTLELREKVTRMIREFAPHCVITHRSTDYHADHRATGTAVLDSIYMLGVPLFCPETPVPETLPFVLYSSDDFSIPRPLRADMIVPVDDVLDQLLAGWVSHDSQTAEWLLPEYGIDPKTFPADVAGRKEVYRTKVREMVNRNLALHRDEIQRVFGGQKLWGVEVYEVSEYGRYPSVKERDFLKSLGFRWTDPASTVISRERVGVCSWSWKLPMREVIAEMEKNGIKGVNLALMPFIENDKYHGGSETPETWQWLKDKVAKGEIKVMSTMISTVGEDYTTIDTIRKTGGIVPDQHWEANKERFRKGAELTKELGCHYLLTHAGFLDEEDPAAFAKYRERVLWIRDVCAKNGVFLILETGQETANALAAFLPTVPGVYVNFDPANMIQYGMGRPMEALSRLIPWIRQIHVKDGKLTAVPGTWGEEVPWGEGEVGGKTFITELEKLGFTGNYVIEREGGDDRKADILLANERLTTME